MLPLLLPLLLGARALSAPPGDTAVVTPLRLDPDINGRPYFRRGPAEAVVFQLSAFGEDFYLHLSPDAGFIAPAFAAHYLGSAPGASRPHHLRHCFYSGDVNADQESFAALSLCGGLRGAFGYRGAEYTISPLPGAEHGGAHRLQRRNVAHPLGTSASRCAVGSGLTPGVLQALEKYRGRAAGGKAGGRTKRFASVPRYVETLVVADESMVKFHGDDLQHYLLTLMATAARLYKHPSIRNPIQISVVKFLLIGQDDKGPKVTSNAALTLRNFCAWQKKWNKVSDKHPEYWDTAILFTKQDLCGATTCDTLGMADVGTMCDPKRSCSVIEDDGLPSAFTTAHELGHVFNMPHDNVKACEEVFGRLKTNHMMSPTLIQIDRANPWSACSAAIITDFLDSGHGDCLLDQPSNAAGLRSNLVTEWDLVCAARWKVPLEQTTHLLGWALGSVAAGMACDRFGRRPTFLVSLGLAVPLGLSVALAIDFVMVLVARLLFGAALAGAFLSLYVARLELCDPPHRLEVTMIAGFSWLAGELLLPGLAVLCRDWRVLQGAVTAVLALLAACWWCPALLLESPCWLLATQQLDKARRTLRALSGSGGAEEQSGTTAEPEALAEQCPQPRYHTVCEIFGTRVIWKNAVILGFTAFIGSGIRHCFTRNLAPHLPRFLPAYFALRGPEAAACLFLCVTAERCGRRAVLLLCAVLTGTASLLLLALTQYLLELIVLMLSVLGVTASHAVTMLSIFFASEVLPTVVRGAGLGLVVGANLVGSAAAPIAAVASSRGFFLHHLVFASFAILAVLSIMLLPESQGRRLPHSLQEGESQRRPPLFRRPPREDHLPLLAPRGIPHDYSRIVPSAQRALGSGRGPAGPPTET